MKYRGHVTLLFKRFFTLEAYVPDMLPCFDTTYLLHVNSVQKL